jgi:hypothetical protein
MRNSQVVGLPDRGSSRSQQASEAGDLAITLVKGRGRSGSQDIHSGGERRLVQRLRIGAVSRHPGSQPLLGTSDRFRRGWHSKVVRQATIPAQRLCGCEKPGFVLTLGQYHTDWRRCRDAFGSTQQPWPLSRRTIVVGIDEHEDPTWPLGLEASELQQCESYGTFELTLLDQCGLVNPHGPWHVQPKCRRDKLPDCSQENRDGFFLPMSFNDTGNGARVHESRPSNREDGLSASR